MEIKVRRKWIGRFSLGLLRGGLLGLITSRSDFESWIKRVKNLNYL
jgi:hypothetical protein